MATWILLILLGIAVFFAARYTYRKARKGECVGCSGCKGGCSAHCGASNKEAASSQPQKRG